MEQACNFSMPFSALPPSIVRGSYELIPIVFSKIALRTGHEESDGSKYLDGWVEMPYADKIARRRAYGARTLHFISGNVPVVAAFRIARAALIKSDNIVKVAPNDPLTAWAIVSACWMWIPIIQSPNISRLCTGRRICLNLKMN